MRALRRKLINDLWNLRWQALAICLVLASGVATFVMSLTTLDSLESTRESYFRTARFGDVFCSLKRAPSALESRLRSVEGVAELEARIVMPALLNMPELPEPATAVLISLPDHQLPQVNRIHLREGRFPDETTRGEAVVSEAFALAHHLHPGEKVEATLNGRAQTLRIVGVGLSPEYVYSVRAGELLPDDLRFGVFWMSYRDLAAANDMDGAFNDVTATLAPHASLPSVLRDLDMLLGPYGGAGAIDRSDQASFRFLENELIQLRGMAVLPPAIFLAVTVFLLHVVMSRLVATQREQAATLRAFGYSQREVLWHYQSFTLALVALGATAGVLAGIYFGADLTKLYSRFFRFPQFHYVAAPRYLLASVAVTAIAAGAATWRSVRQVAALAPAVAMQPEPPARYRPSVVERFAWLRSLPPTVKMVLRNLERRPFRAAFTSLGVSLAIAILVLGNFTEDTIDFVMHFQFELANRQDMTVTFLEPSSGRAIHDLRHLAGVRRVEPFRAAPVRVRFGHRSRRLAVMGLASDAELFRALHVDGRSVSLPAEGIVISEMLAEILECRAGDVLRLEVLDGARPTLTVPIAGVVRDFVDLNAYMRLDELRRLLREQETASGAFLQVDQDRQAELFSQLKSSPRVASVGIVRSMRESYRQTLAENVLRIRTINLVFASIVAFGVVYNAARVTLAERSRELATLRVLGFHRSEVSFVLLAEIGLLVLLAIPPGLLIGYGFSALLTWALATEIHRFPLKIGSGTFLLTVAITMAASMFSAMIVRRRIDRFDLVAVLKARD